MLQQLLLQSWDEVETVLVFLSLAVCSCIRNVFGEDKGTGHLNIKNGDGRIPVSDGAEILVPFKNIRT